MGPATGEEVGESVEIGGSVGKTGEEGVGDGLQRYVGTGVGVGEAAFDAGVGLGVNVGVGLGVEVGVGFGDMTSAGVAVGEALAVGRYGPKVGEGTGTGVLKGPFPIGDLKTVLSFFFANHQSRKEKASALAGRIVKKRPKQKLKVSKSEAAL